MNTNKFLFNSGAMLSALQTIGKVMERRPVVPILENYLFQVKDGTLTVSGTDLQNTFRLSFPIENKQADFSACVPPVVIKYIDKLIKGEGSAPLTLVYDAETYGIEITDAIARAKYAGDNPIDFPIARQTDFDVFETSSKLFKEFKDLLVYVSADQLRPAMTGIAFTNHENKMYCAATDGHRVKVLNIQDEVLIYPGIKADKDNQYFILPAKAAKILSELNFKKETAGVMVRNGDHDGNQYVSFSFKYGAFDAEFITRPINERYPDYWNVIPEEKSTLTRYTNQDKAKFLSVLDRAQLFANATTHQIRLSLNGKLKLSAEDLDFKNEYSAEIEGSYEGEPIEIGFNAMYLSECINSFGNTFTMEMRKPNHAAVIRDEKSIVLCMPVMLNQYA